ncbi:GAF domain-containing protein [Bacillus sp. JJ722]|uniref:GAF domain-containing protein n=1 Tax=Bacillus sp. JJ722 TaxID=3122973 RepID=UPI002FFE42C0
MFKVENYSGTLEEKYELLNKQLASLIEGEQNLIANLSNFSALLNVFLERINWVGFYLMENDELVLGPFQGLPACIRIPSGRGVCGKAAKRKETMIVEDVEQFPGHIACDAASRSEIVIPIFKNNEVIGVLDIDSPELNRFSKEEGLLLEKVVKTLEKQL